MITAVTANYKTTDFFYLLEKSLLKNTENLSKIVVGSHPKERIISKTSKVYYKEIDESQGSKNHGKMLNYLMKQIDSPYTLIIDTDCFVVKTGWDIFLRPLLDKYDLIGAQHFRTDKLTETPLLHASFLFGKTKNFKNIDFQPDFERNMDTGGNASLVLEKKLELEHKNPSKHFTNVKCAEYVYANDVIYYHFGRGARLRGGQENKQRWVTECNQLL